MTMTDTESLVREELAGLAGVLDVIAKFGARDPDILSDYGRRAANIRTLLDETRPDYIRRKTLLARVTDAANAA